MGRNLSKILKILLKIDKLIRKKKIENLIVHLDYTLNEEGEEVTIMVRYKVK